MPKSKKAKAPERPGEPKGPRNYYILFQQDKLEKLTAENPDMSHKEKLEIIASMWENRTEAETIKYQQLAALDKERFLREKSQLDAVHSVVDTASSSDVATATAVNSSIQSLMQELQMAFRSTSQKENGNGNVSHLRQSPSPRSSSKSHSQTSEDPPQASAPTKRKIEDVESDDDEEPGKNQLSGDRKNVPEAKDPVKKHKSTENVEPDQGQPDDEQ